MPPHNRQGAGADEKTFGPPPAKVDEKPFSMPEDPFAQMRGPYGETFRDDTEVADQIADLIDKGVDRECTHFHLQHDDRQKLLVLVKMRRNTPTGSS